MYRKKEYSDNGVYSKVSDGTVFLQSENKSTGHGKTEVLKHITDNHSILAACKKN